MVTLKLHTVLTVKNLQFFSCLVMMSEKRSYELYAVEKTAAAVLRPSDGCLNEILQ